MLTGCLLGCIMFRFQKNKYAFKNKFLIMTSNARLKNVTISFRLVRILNHTLQGMTEANSCKSCSTLFQLSKINHVI